MSFKIPLSPYCLIIFATFNVVNCGYDCERAAFGDFFDVIAERLGNRISGISATVALFHRGAQYKTAHDCAASLLKAIQENHINGNDADNIIAAYITLYNTIWFTCKSIELWGSKNSVGGVCSDIYLAAGGSAEGVATPWRYERTEPDEMRSANHDENDYGHYGSYYAGALS